MASTSVHTIGSELQTMPVALLFSNQVLLTEKSPVELKSQPSGAKMDDLWLRATRVTEILTEIKGYRHGGLDD
jgi:hypothetical protein